ncbi:HNH endonuclease [Guyparkeria sp. SCN-R1]|uniref:HNH endonuclease n=1 Tax=Guyparkeria sp. SCN-R1 TaxID=2341113 RepID=UPI000F6543CB|nr:HNH endonuclease signature motif containing protein [Guyparkeria sp. SCN-R1]RRQ23801.1 HNH endonuclease [Guyparkeria sp. SCN-R1]
MYDNVISYFEMCTRERMSLQRGMNFRIRGRHSVVLMSVRANAPYQDRLEEGGSVLIYEGHDAPASAGSVYPKLLDQPERLPSGRLTENGKFHQAAQEYKNGVKPPDMVRVYEKIKKGIWSDNGYFQLVDSWKEHDGHRQVFKFKLLAVETELEDLDAELPPQHSDQQPRRRVIPSAVKLEVWKRDGGKCVECGATDELHFDHIVPYSKGGTSLKAENVQLLCARHNLAKSTKIQ